MEYGNPTDLDRVACEFPNLKIIACPPGWPWVMDLIAAAWRHPNVYICTAPVRPKYFAKEGTGWEPLLTYVDSLISDKILFGTSWPLLPLKRTIEEIRTLPLKPEVIEKWLSGNLQRLLGV
jgi:predicted TIM-barrel fold metal-dependent hydrolase